LKTSSNAAADLRRQALAARLRYKGATEALRKVIETCNFVPAGLKEIWGDVNLSGNDEVFLARYS
jgi:hypothetical protein